jgi:hypothetical protein
MKGNAMKTATHGNGRGLDDLYILPDSPEEARKITDYVRSINCSYSWSVSDVKGQDWYGKAFIEIPFGEPLLGDIQKETR